MIAAALLRFLPIGGVITVIAFFGWASYQRGYDAGAADKQSKWDAVETARADIRLADTKRRAKVKETTDAMLMALAERLRAEALANERHRNEVNQRDPIPPAVVPIPKTEPVRDWQFDVGGLLKRWRCKADNSLCAVPTAGSTTRAALSPTADPPGRGEPNNAG